MFYKTIFSYIFILYLNGFSHSPFLLGGRQFVKIPLVNPFLKFVSCVPPPLWGGEGPGRGEFPISPFWWTPPPGRWTDGPEKESARNHNLLRMGQTPLYK